MKMHRANSQVAYHALAAIRNLCDEESNQGRAGAAGGVEAVVDALKCYNTDARIQEQGCAALTNLCQIDKNRRTARNVGGMVAGSTRPSCFETWRENSLIPLYPHLLVFFEYILLPISLIYSALLSSALLDSTRLGSVCEHSLNYSAAMGVPI